ncbi:Actin depolymerizing factor [Klebsormidium nitens]|uniref:Actin depolymerizing factor n=1 Tax=Klebsormidium nitens TaxID=105231 RepID=A0A1Y1IA64_KLENI|nr:Actin depolymerizing factor [Klebsormidium nitens]|eukprot:GAQ84988.1 Actin depolymerizing factor [Klebsormidium nitens]
MANASSGVGVEDDCKLKFLDLKNKRAYPWIIFKVDDAKGIVVVERLGKADEDYEVLRAALPENDCRYLVYDYNFVTEDNCQKSKIFFIAWSPDTSPVRRKMIYATSKDRFRRELDGVQLEIQATDQTEIDIDELKSRANR